MRKLLFLLVLPLLFSCNGNSSAEADSDNTKTAVEMPVYKSELIGVMDQTIDKYVSLAEALPAEAYDWRPEEGVRSVKEAMMHVTGANFFFAQMMGAEIPEDVDPRALEAEGKDEVIALYKQATSLFKDAIANISDEELAAKQQFFDGNEYSTQMISMINLSHTSEHLGQLIAYARSNHITPPWSEAE